MIETQINLPTVVESLLESDSFMASDSAVFQNNTTIGTDFYTMRDFKCQGSVQVNQAAYFNRELSILGKLDVSFNPISNIPNPTNPGEVVNVETIRRYFTHQYMHFRGAGDRKVGENMLLPFRMMEQMFSASPDYQNYFEFSGNTEELTVKQGGIYTFSMTLSKRGNWVVPNNGTGSNFLVTFGSVSIGAFTCRGSGWFNQPGGTLSMGFHMDPSSPPKILSCRAEKRWFRLGDYSWSLVRHYSDV